MRNLKKIIAVVVTLVMLFAITSISASAAAAPVFSLRGATEVNFLKEVETEGDPAQYYELAVYLEDADSQVGAIQGVITYDTEVFSYKAAELGSALKADDTNRVDNSIKVQYDESEAETGTIKFVGLSEKAGEWFIIKFVIKGEKEGAAFGLVARGSNKEGSASLVVNTKSIASTIVDEELINMEGGAILQKTHGLSSEKHIIHGTGYKPEEGAEKKVMNATLIRPKVDIVVGQNISSAFSKGANTTYTVVDSTATAFDYPSVGLTFTSADETVTSGEVKYNYFTSASATNRIYANASHIMMYVETPADKVTTFYMQAAQISTDSGSTAYNGTYNGYDPLYCLAVGADEWKTIYPNWQDEYNRAYGATSSGNAYRFALPAGFKGIICLDNSKFVGYTSHNFLRLQMLFGNVAVGDTVVASIPWITHEFNTTDYEGWYVNTADKAEEPTQELTFDVKVDAEELALKEAALNSKVVEVGTLFMYTKRLAYRELTLDMTDKTGLAKASRVLEDGETLESFTVNLKNIRWDAMGVSVSARAYIKFKDGTVIYSRNYHNEFETNAGYARESVIGVALDAIDAGHYDTVLAANYGYDVNSIQSIATTALSTHKLTGDDRILLLNFIADCYKAPEVVA